MIQGFTRLFSHEGCPRKYLSCKNHVGLPPLNSTARWWPVDEALAQAAGSLSGCCHKSSTSTGHQGENEMPGFCRNCGSPLADGQAFCAKCGTRVGEVSQPSAGVPAPAAAVPPPSPPVYAAPAQSSAPVAPTKTSPLVKILVAVVLVFVAFGAIGIAAMVYIGHRIHQKAEDGAWPGDFGFVDGRAARRRGRAPRRAAKGPSLLRARLRA